MLRQSTFGSLKSPYIIAWELSERMNLTGRYLQLNLYGNVKLIKGRYLTVGARIFTHSSGVAIELTALFLK